MPISQWRQRLHVPISRPHILSGAAESTATRKGSSGDQHPPDFTFIEAEGSLALYAAALSEGKLRLNGTAGAQRGSYSDGRTIFLPSSIPGDPDLARRRYRMMIAWNVLSVRSGALDPELIEALLATDQPGTALALYDLLHGESIDRRIAHTWLGLRDDLTSLRAAALERRSGDDVRAEPGIEPLRRLLLAQPLHGSDLALEQDGALPWLNEELARGLTQFLTDGLPQDCLELTRQLTEHLGSAGPQHSDQRAALIDYRGHLRVDLLRRLPSYYEDDEDIETSDRRHREPKAPRKPPRSDPIQIEARTPEQNALRERRAGPRGGRQAVQLSLADREASWTLKQVPLTDEDKEGALLFDEWDYRHDCYESEWCALRTRRLRSGDPTPIERILRRNAPLVTRLKQEFELLRPERVRLTRQLDGDGLDISALVDDRADRHAGFSPSEKVYSRTLERERNIALHCLVDLSGSTGAWIDDDPRNEQVIEITRRALVFLCEALSVLDDRYAISGFSGSTRKHCQISIVKGFEESYGETIKGRIAGISPGAYTRIGPAVRYATQELLRQPAKVHLLLLISDGRPNDFDGYGGRYGIEDTRRSLIEGRQKGVATFALTIDAEARDYMPYMFGRGHYVMIEDISTLAVKLSGIYRRLTVT